MERELPPHLAGRAAGEVQPEMVDETSSLWGRIAELRERRAAGTPQRRRAQALSVVVERLFEIYETREALTIAEAGRLLDQPRGVVREALESIGERSAQHKGKYVVRADYNPVK